jgi:hypothetical protein
MYVGGSLLALLLLCAALLPKPPVADSTVASASDVPAIRIHSQQKWPERVVLDTNAPMPAPAEVAQAAVAPAEPQAKTGVREAFAQLPNGEAKQQAVTDVKKPDPKPPVRRRSARRQAPQQPYPQGYYGYQGYGYPRRMQVAQQPRFGFFW